MSLAVLTPEQVAALRASHRVVTIGPAELAPLGIGRGDWVEPLRRRPATEPP
jgi:hypothetical protein